MNQTLEIGNKAPNFNLPNQNGNSVRLDDFAGRWLVVYFYPRDDTPGCTIEAKEFTDSKKYFEENEATIMGVSPDNEAKHCKFIDKHGLKIDLLADCEMSLLADYGVWQEKSL